jgi:hypothetical protein
VWQLHLNKGSLDPELQLLTVSFSSKGMAAKTEKSDVKAVVNAGKINRICREASAIVSFSKTQTNWKHGGSVQIMINRGFY